MKNPKVRSNILIIILVMAAFILQSNPAGAASLVSTDKDIYNYGEKIKVKFSSSPGNERDWICIVPVGSPDTEAGDYKYLPKDLVQGTLTFDPPLPGKYEVRAYYNYDRNGYVVSGRYAFSVKGGADYEKAKSLRMESLERKIDIKNPLEANVAKDKGLIYIFREPVPESGMRFVGDTTILNVQIKADGKHLAVMPIASYYVFEVSAGNVNITTGRLSRKNIFQESNIEEEVYVKSAGEATIKVKPGCVYYLKLSVIFKGYFGTSLESIACEEGAKLIDQNKLTRIK